MTSFLSRMANEATAALSDAYGHVMHGDDAGSSARLVWVVHPTKVPIDLNLGGDGTTAGGINSSAGNGTGKKSSSGKKKLKDDSSTGSPGRNGSSSVPSSYFFTQKFDLGLTFLEINDRAYVRTVDEGSAAALAGIQPQDCIQFACVVGGPQFEHVKPRNIAVIGENSTSPRGSSRRNRLEEQENENERQKLDAKATTFAVECEKSGIRTSYEELRELFAGCTVPPKGGSSNVNESAAHHDPMTTPNRKIQVLASTPGSSKRITITTDDDFTIGDSNSLLLADSVGGMFETGRTKKHNGNISSRCVPSLPDNKTAKTVTRSVTNVARNATVRCFAGGDDNDTQGVDFSEDRFRSRTSGDSKGLLMDLPSTPIKSGGIITTSSPRSQGRSGGGDGISYEDSVMEQQLYPVAMVFRRTVQRKRILSPGKGWGSPGLSLRGSLFGIPSFRMDDECDRAAALIRQLASSRKDHSGSLDQGAFIGDDSDSLQASSVATNPDRPGSNDDIEASTIRGMIQNAVGLGFVRTSKVVVGVSLQAGSGIVVARLPDGTWSAPSAVGVCGLGVGLQFGLEVADYMFILQTKEGVEHFQRGGNFAVGGNIGAAVASVGREAYGAASLGGCSSLNLDDQIQQGDTDDEDDDGAESTYYDGSTRRSNASSSVRSRKQNKKKDSDVAPMVAYAKSQGLYFGVSVDGLKFFTRNDINARAYKFSMLSEMAATDILSGLVAPPPEAEDLYAALHSVEYVHEITELPRPPEMLRKDSMNDWRYDRSIAAVKGEIIDSSSRNVGSRPLYSFLSSLNREEANECALFETKFKKFLYGGVAVQRLMPNAAPTTPSGMTRREKRTLWLMLPEVGSLRLGLVSKFKDDNGDDATMDDVTLVSSIASSRFDADDQNDLNENGNVKLSKKYSVSLTDITVLSQDPSVTVRLSPDDATEHLRIVSIQDVTGRSLLFLASTNREAELLVCGLKLLLECESARLGVRGGMQLNKLGGEIGKGALSPSAARGSFKVRGSSRDKSGQAKTRHLSQQGYSSIGEHGSSSDSSDNNDESDELFARDNSAKINNRHQVPEGRSSWSQVPSRNRMREIADSATSPRNHTQIPPYVLGKEVSSHIVTDIYLPLPIPLCRVLFLDSSSPVNKAWENGRGDIDYQRTVWSFPPGAPREFEKNTPEQQLISGGSMVGAQRTVSYKRMRNRELVRLSETITVERDTNQTLSFAIVDRMPRRGFSVKTRVILRSSGAQSCDASVIAELRPIGKNLSDQIAVHKAFILVLDEIKVRYGFEGKAGLLAIVIDTCNSQPPVSPQRAQSRNVNSFTDVLPANSGSKKASLTSFKDVLIGSKVGSATTSRSSSESKPVSIPSSNNSSTVISSQAISPRRLRNDNVQERPSTPSIRAIESKSLPVPSKNSNGSLQQNPVAHADDFADFSQFNVPKNPASAQLVEVKPLPKLRLDLCPVPREEDEEEESAGSFGGGKQKKKSKKHKHRRSSRNH